MKKFTKDIRFLVAVFVLVFVVLGAAAINAIPSKDKPSATPPSVPAPANGGSTADETPTTTEFYFKAPVLRLDINSSTHTSFLIVGNQAAITDGWVEGAAVNLTINPFAIDVLMPGQAQVNLSARMSNGSIKTITCTVEVVGDDTTKDFGKDKNISNIGELLYEFESDTSIVFNLLVNNETKTAFRLFAVVLEGDVAVGVLANVVRIKHFSGNPYFKIKVAALLDGAIVAVEEVENRL